MQYQNYLTDVLEFAECDRIYVKGSSPYCIFGTEKFVSPKTPCLNFIALKMINVSLSTIISYSYMILGPCHNI
jgi:hypothetical protein